MASKAILYENDTHSCSEIRTAVSFETLEQDAGKKEGLEAHQPPAQNPLPQNVQKMSRRVVRLFGVSRRSQ